MFSNCHTGLSHTRIQATVPLTMSMLRSAHSLEQGTSGHSRQDERACSSETATFAVRTAYCCIHSTFGTSLPARRPRRIVLVCIEGLDIARTRRRDPFRARAHLDRRKQVRALHESTWQRGCATAWTFKSARLDTLGTVGGPGDPQSLARTHALPFLAAGWSAAAQNLLATCSASAHTTCARWPGAGSCSGGCEMRSPRACQTLWRAAPQ